MDQPMAMLTKSRFYSLALNAAVFDGPLRIYFSQPHESRALKIYFRMQALLKIHFENQNPSSLESFENIFVMLYPNKDSFEEIFPSQTEKGFGVSRLQQDWVIGINFESLQFSLESILMEFQKILQSWETTLAEEDLPPAAVPELEVSP